MKKLSAIFFTVTFSIAFIYPSSSVLARTSKQDMLFATVQIYIYDKDREEVRSSGTGLIIGNNRVLTALHVVSPVARDHNRFEAHVCIIFAEDDKPACLFISEHVENYSETFDLATLKLTQGFDFDKDKFIDFNEFLKKYDASEYLSPKNYLQHIADRPSLGDEITILGYPFVGGNNISLTKGVISGFGKGEVNGKEAVVDVRTDAKINHGNSGGPAFTKDGELVGIAVATSTDISDIGHLVATAPIKSFINNKQERIYGEVCYDYGDGYKEDGECICKDGYEWNEERLYCAEIGAEEEKEGTKNSQGGDMKAEDTEEDVDGGTEAEESVESTTEESTENEASEESADVASDTEEESSEAHILQKSLRDVILETLQSCKQDSDWGDRAAYRSCIKESIKSFIQEKSRIKRELTKECRDEVGNDRKTIEKCVDEKISE